MDTCQGVPFHFLKVSDFTALNPCPLFYDLSELRIQSENGIFCRSDWRPRRGRQEKNRDRVASDR